MSLTHDHLFAELTALIPTLDGWCSPERACDLARIVLENNFRTTVCLGVWGGRDTFALALAHRANQFGKCVAVDPFSAGASVVGQDSEADRAWWSDQQKHDLVHGRFTGNAHRLGLAQWIEFQRTTSAEAVVPDEIGLLIVDGNHGPDSIADVEKWVPKMAPHSWVYADDLNWTGGAVLRAVERLKEFGFVERFKRDTGAFFERTSISLPASPPESSRARVGTDGALAASGRKGRAKK